MSDAERQRRRRERLAAEHAAQPREPSAQGAEKDREIGALRRRAAAAETAAATLKRQLDEAQAAAETAAATLKKQLEEAQARPAAASSGGTDYAKAYTKLWGDHARVTGERDALKKQLADARAAAPGVTPGEEKAAGRLAREIERLNEALAKAEAQLADAPGEAAKLAGQLKGARTRIKTLDDQVKPAYLARDAAQAELRRVIATIKRECRKLRAHFHPDREGPKATAERKAWATNASQTVNELLDELISRIEKR